MSVSLLVVLIFKSIKKIYTWEGILPLDQMPGEFNLYVVGVVVGSRMLKNKTLWKQERFGFLVEWALLFAGTIFAFTMHPDAANLAGHVLLALLAISMGILNALIRVHGLPDMATNALT